MLDKVKVRLRPIVSNLNLPTIIKTTILPGDSSETLFIATQVGEIFYIRDGIIGIFLDIRQEIISLGTTNGGYDERGLLGLAFHPYFAYNGLFYLHYSKAGSQGPGALTESFTPNPTNIHLKWTNRETQFDHIDTVDEWIYQPNSQPSKRRTLLNVKRPFSNHNGVNSLHFSPETGNLIFTNGDGGSGFDPFNLSQTNIEIAGKIIEIDVNKQTFIDNPPIVTQFSELPAAIQETLSVMAIGIRNIPGIAFQTFTNQTIKYAGNVGQDLVESIFAFSQYEAIPVTKLVQGLHTELINFGWRAWEGTFPTSVIKDSNEKTIAYYDEAIQLSSKHLHPLTCYYHQDSRPEAFQGTALTGVQVYTGQNLPALTGSVVFTDLLRKDSTKGVLAYTKSQNDYHVIEVDYDFGEEPAYFVSLGSNMNQTALYLGVYRSMKVTEMNKGTVFEVIL